MPAPTDSAALSPDPQAGRIGALARLFLKLGFVAFGGPAAHIAMLEDEVVERRGWLSRQHFLDLIGATNLVPGPNSTEMVMHVGYERAGWGGLFVAGACFIGPAVLLTGILAWMYVTYGEVPAVAPLLVGIKPAVLAIILGALWKLGKKAIKGWRLGVLALAVTAAVLAGAGEVPALFVAGILGALWLKLSRTPDSGSAARLLPLLFLQTAPAAGGAAAASMAAGAVGGVSLWKLFGFFLKVGSVLYGSGYVLVAFLEGDLVGSYGWLTQGQLLDAIAIGQFTPGPVLSTATFVGYLIEGVPGALVATLGIFLPSFVFVGLLNPLVPRLRESAWLSAFLDAVNAAAVALMAAVTLELGMAVLLTRHPPPTTLPPGDFVVELEPVWSLEPVALVLFALAALAVLRFKLSTVWIVLGGAALGYAWFLVAG